MSLLMKDQLKKVLAGLNGWILTDKELRKKFELTDFVHAMGFVNSVALIAERANHHPNIEIRWNVVELSLTTHSEGGITGKDISLANEIDSLVC